MAHKKTAKKACPAGKKLIHIPKHTVKAHTRCIKKPKK